MNRTLLLGRYAAIWGGWGMLALLLCLAAPALAAVTERVNVSSEGGQDLFDVGPLWPLARLAAISGDGGYVVFSSDYALAPGDTNGMANVYVRSRVTNATELVSISSTGEQGNGHSGSVGEPRYGLDISSDGRYVVFTSAASNWAPGDVNLYPDVFLRDRLAGTTQLISVSLTGEPGNYGGCCPVVSDDGRYVLFFSDSTNLVPDDLDDRPALFLRDRVSGITEQVQAYAEADFLPAAMSEDGRYVSWSEVVSDDHGSIYDVFLKDRLTGATELVSVSLDEWRAWGDSYLSDMSPDVRYVSFDSAAPNLVVGDTNERLDAFLRDRATGVTERVSVSSSETEGWADPWDPGGYDGPYYESRGPGVSADGRFVCFTSTLHGLIPESWDNPVLEWHSHVYLRDRAAGTTELVDVTRSGGFDPLRSSFTSHGDSISFDGRCIGFLGYSSELVPGDTNEVCDIFVRDLDARFHDVSSRYWAFHHIEACVAAGLVGGYPNNTYRPKFAVTRDQMAVYISRALAGGDALVPPGPATATFPDVPNDQWAYKYVEYAVDNGVVGGYWDGTYRPELTVDRGQMAVFVARAMAGGDSFVPTGPATAFFPDVPTDFWAFKYVEYIRGEGVTGGYPDGTYRPTEACTRDQMAVYVQRAFALPM